MQLTPQIGECPSSFGLRGVVVRCLLAELPGGSVALPPGMRKQPAQQRSEQTVEAILSAADAVFAEVGVDAANTTMISARAGISVGSLYRFYSDKVALAEALADRYLDDLAFLFFDVDALVGTGDTSAIRDGVKLMVNGVARLYDKYPGYFAVVQHLNPARSESPAHHVRTAQIEALGSWFALTPGEPDPVTATRIAEFLIDATRVLIERTPPQEPERTAHLDDVVQLLAPYLEHHLS